VEAERHLLKQSGSTDPGALVPFLRAAPLGRYLVWATFDVTDPTNDPFDSLPKSHVGICSALGLGHFKAALETLIVLVWDHAESGSPDLHRPTVADAEDFAYYRPCPIADNPWGFTGPLPPNVDGIPPQPEVVMAEIDGRGLLLPFRVVYA
jgi:hypothetical protein